MYRILIVEDDTAMADTMAGQLKAWGNQVHIVTDFQNVVGEFEDYAPQLVILDVMLPFYNGYHWCSEIRKGMILLRNRLISMS
jgi:DNA-binding response OmpR family regulator